MLRRLGPAALIALGVFILIATIGHWRYAEAVATPAAVPLPKALAGLPLVTDSYGPQAIAEITRLHGKGFLLTSGGMGMYGNRGQATLWVSGAPVSFMATQLVEAMRDKIASSNSPFTLVAERRQTNRIIYELDGMGQKHFYFQSAALVVWLAADPDIAEKALKETMEFYP